MLSKSGLHLSAIMTSKLILSLLSSKKENGFREVIVLLLINDINPIEVTCLQFFIQIFSKYGKELDLAKNSKS